MAKVWLSMTVGLRLPGSSNSFFFSVLSGVRLVPQSGHFCFFLGISAPVEADVVMPRV